MKRHSNKINTLWWNKEKGSWLTDSLATVRPATDKASQYYTIIDFNEVDIRIYLPEKVNIAFKGR